VGTTVVNMVEVCSSAAGPSLTFTVMFIHESPAAGTETAPSDVDGKDIVVVV